MNLSVMNASHCCNQPVSLHRVQCQRTAAVALTIDCRFTGPLFHRQKQCYFCVLSQPIGCCKLCAGGRRLSTGQVHTEKIKGSGCAPAAESYVGLAITPRDPGLPARLPPTQRPGGREVIVADRARDVAGQPIPLFPPVSSCHGPCFSNVSAFLCSL